MYFLRVRSDVRVRAGQSAIVSGITPVERVTGQHRRVIVYPERQLDSLPTTSSTRGTDDGQSSTEYARETGAPPPRCRRPRALAAPARTPGAACESCRQAAGRGADRGDTAVAYAERDGRVDPQPAMSALLFCLHLHLEALRS